MARGSSYGETLREARMRKGTDLPSVARRLRVRADILAAIEEADFAALPPSGYTRNMINAYARLVGADPREVSSRYLDELHLFETGRTRMSRERAVAAGDPMAHRGSAHPSRTIRSRAPMPHRRPTTATRPAVEGASGRPVPLQRAHAPAPSRSYNLPSNRYRERYGAEGREPYGAASRALPAPDRAYGGYDAHMPQQRYPQRMSRSYGAPPQRPYGEPRSYGRDTLRAYDSYAFRPDEPRPERSAPASRNRALPASEYATSPYAGLYSRRDHSQKATVGDVVGGSINAIIQRLPLVIGVVVVIVVLILIVSFIGRGGEPAPDETPTMPISGLTDTSTQNADAYNMSATETAPTSAKFSVEVASGGRSWMELTVDDASTPEIDGVMDGPMTKEVEFTESISFSCGNVSPVTIKLDGKEVKPTKSSGDGEYVYTVTFSSILSEWQRAHPTAPGIASGSSSSSSASGSSSSSSSSASSSR